jgi:4-hydroxythreonine-4-phosphate dehydrogenase
VPAVICAISAAMQSSTIASDPAIRPLAVALGDPAGIGPEIVAKSWQARETSGLPPFFAVGDSEAVRAVWNGPLREIADPADALEAYPDALPIIRVGNGGTIPGSPSLDGARNALDSLEIAVGLTRSGAASGLVTGPISKAQFYAIGFTHAGQTEFVAERCGVSRDIATMMLVGPTLKTVPATVHLPLRDVPDALTVDLIVARGRAIARGLTRQFGIEAPRIAVAALNPHAGENGMLGREEIETIIPAIERLREEGILVSGPYAADAMFHARMRETYDAALCMYHDQALVPLKTLHFDEGVNMTLGLPIVRTSPDHGTAFDIAGQDRANPGAMIAALKTAQSCARFIAAA